MDYLPLVSIPSVNPQGMGLQVIFIVFWIISLVTIFSLYVPQLLG